MADRPAAAFTRIGAIYDQIMAGVPYGEWVAYVDSLWERFATASPAEPLLDLACGTGTVALAWAQRGQRAIGLDSSAEMLAQAQVKAAAAGLRVPWLLGDMTALPLAARSMGRVVCVFDSLNYLLREAALRRAVAEAARVLRPGGLFIFDVNTEYALAQELFTQEERDSSGRLRLRWRSRYDAESRRCTVEMGFWPPEGLPIHELHRQRAHTPRELEQAIDLAGLELRACYEAYTLRPPQSTSDRVYYVCAAPPAG